MKKTFYWGSQFRSRAGNQSRDIVLTRYVEAPRKNNTMTPVHIERFRNTLGGIKARSCRAHCTPTKRRASAKAPTRSPMMVADFHGFVCPPHWRASRRQTIAPMNRTQPTGSMDDNLAESGSLRFSLSSSLIRRKMLSATRTTKPIGTFLGCCQRKHRRMGLHCTHIQKHHLQVLCCVNDPPSGGPALVAMAKTLTTTPMYIGRFFSVTT
jgi:hypothetical protein